MYIKWNRKIYICELQVKKMKLKNHIIMKTYIFNIKIIKISQTINTHKFNIIYTLVNNDIVIKT
jgi:hypothetical protein